MRTRGEGGSEHDQKYAFCTQVQLVRCTRSMRLKYETEENLIWISYTKTAQVFCAYSCLVAMVLEGTVSQMFHLDPSSQFMFFQKSRSQLILNVS